MADIWPDPRSVGGCSVWGVPAVRPSGTTNGGRGPAAKPRSAGVPWGVPLVHHCSAGNAQGSTRRSGVT